MPLFLKKVCFVCAVFCGGVIPLASGCYKSIDISEVFPNADTIELPGLGIHQSFVIHNGKGFFVTPSDDGLICDLYDLKSARFVSQIKMPHDRYAKPHANTSCLGSLLFSDNSICPVVYVSAWNNKREAFVYDLKCVFNEYSCSLVQVIDPSSISESIIGGGYLDWVVDADNGFLYSLAYHIKNTSRVINGNYIHVTKFLLPPLSEDYVALNDSDVVETFVVPMMAVFQDKAFYAGCIYIVAGISDDSGLYPPRLYVINTNNKEQTELDIPIDGEPEGFCFYEGHKWLNMYGSTIIYNLDELLSD